MFLKINPYNFIQVGHEKDSGVHAPEDRALFNNIRDSWPELKEWGDRVLSVAWGSYHKNVYFSSWVAEPNTLLNRTNLLDFIAYIIWHEVNGEPEWGIEHAKLLEFAKEQNLAI